MTIHTLDDYRHAGQVVLVFSDIAEYVHATELLTGRIDLEVLPWRVLPWGRIEVSPEAAATLGFLCLKFDCETPAPTHAVA